MTFYVNPSCAVLRNNKQHVGRESINAWKKADFDGFREKEEKKCSIFHMELMQDICRGSVGPLERTEGSATRPSSR